MAFPSEETLHEIIYPLAQARGLDIENVSIHKREVRISLDSDDRPTLDEYEAIAGEISSLFDDRETAGELDFGAGYMLEVGSPGTDFPLTAPRHWRRNRNRVVKMGDKLFRIGALSEDEEEVILVATSVGTKGRNVKPRVYVQQLGEVERAVVEIEFGNPRDVELELTNKAFEEAEQLREDNK